MRASFFIIAVLTAVGSLHAESVRLLDGKLKLDTTDAFVSEKKASTSRQSIADFKARESEGWGTICGTNVPNVQRSTSNIERPMQTNPALKDNSEGFRESKIDKITEPVRLED